MANLAKAEWRSRGLFTCVLSFVQIHVTGTITPLRRLSRRTLSSSICFIRAVRRLFEKEGDEEAVAPNVVVINLSIGIRDRPFDSSLSPLARLLDWLAWRYRVLFVVSSGNHSQRIGLSIPRGTVHELQREELQAEIVRAVAADARYRRLLSPAEAVNALTVGATSLDSSNGRWPPQWIEAYAEPSLPSPINAQGMGYRRAIKPEVLAPGGRTLIQDYPSGNENAEVSLYNGSRPPGQCVASPGAIPGDIKRLMAYTGHEQRDGIW